MPSSYAAAASGSASSSRKPIPVAAATTRRPAPSPAAAAAPAAPSPSNPSGISNSDPSSYSSGEETDLTSSDPAAAYVVSSYLSVAGDGADLSKVGIFLRSAARRRSPPCLICFDPIRPSDPVWSCSASCFALLHLHCIQSWAHQSASAVPSPTWGCPKCRFPYPKSQTPTSYLCFCSKTVDPVATSVVDISMRIVSLAVSTPASCCAIQDLVRRARLLFQMPGAFVAHTARRVAARISVILARGNAINASAVESIGVLWIAMMGLARHVRCEEITNVSVERQWRRGCALKGCSSARGSVVGCWSAGSIVVRGVAMQESVENAHSKGDELAHVGRKIIQVWTVMQRLPHADQLARRCSGAGDTNAMSGAIVVCVLRQAVL